MRRRVGLEHVCIPCDLERYPPNSLVRSRISARPTPTFVPRVVEPVEHFLRNAFTKIHHCERGEGVADRSEISTTWLWE